MNKFNWNGYDTDKDKTKGAKHGYGKLYDKHFENIRADFDGTIIEIGSKIGSANLWLDYFPNAKFIVCCDLNEFNHSDNRFIFKKFNQLSKKDNESLLKEYSNVDVIMDDGPHTPDAQLTSLQYMLPIMKSNSWFVMEDMHATEPNDPHYKHNMRDSDINVGDLLKEWKNDIYNTYKYIPNPKGIVELDLDIFIEKGRISEIAFIHKK